jgi:hypothetical protein
MNNEIRQFDLNIERVLEHWTVAHALREIIANALDEASARVCHRFLQIVVRPVQHSVGANCTGRWAGCDKSNPYISEFL